MTSTMLAAITTTSIVSRHIQPPFPAIRYLTTLAMNKGSFGNMSDLDNDLTSEERKLIHAKVLDRGQTRGRG